jgi:hypothetical protein
VDQQPPETIKEGDTLFVDNVGGEVHTLVGYDVGEGVADQRPQQVPTPTAWSPCAS